MAAEGRARRALFAYSLGVLVLVAGIVVAAAGLETAVAHPHGHLTAWAAWTLASGVGIYLLGLGLFRRLLGLSGAGLRPAFVVPVLACALLGTDVNGSAEVAAITAVLVVAVVLDSRSGPVLPDTR